jgi:hypothetical protein
VSERCYSQGLNIRNPCACRDKTDLCMIPVELAEVRRNRIVQVHVHVGKSRKFTLMGRRPG